MSDHTLATAHLADFARHTEEIASGAAHVLARLLERLESDDVHARAALDDLRDLAQDADEAMGVAADAAEEERTRELNALLVGGAA